MFFIRFLTIIVIGVSSGITFGQQKSDALLTPNSSVNYAIKDLESIQSVFLNAIPPQDPKSATYKIRYLSLYNFQNNVELKRSKAKTVSFVINSLSKRKKSYIPVFVSGSNETLIRINLDDYGIDPKQWDELGRKGSGEKPRFEPWFHALAQKVNLVNVVPIEEEIEVVERVLLGNDIRGNPVYQNKTVKKKVPKQADADTKKIEEVLVPAPWLDPFAITHLYELSGSEFPILRADWFITNAMMEPAYHLLLGFGDDEKSFADFVGADEKLATKFRSQDKGVVVKSKVALNNRTLVRSPAQKGYYWVSHDTLKSVDDRNYAQNFLDEKFDATEIIATLPNGLQIYFIGDAKGKRLNKADNEIAHDYEHSDGIVRSARSCITCHATGLQSIEDEIRIMSFFGAKNKTALITIDDEKRRRLEDLFDSDLEKQIFKDRQIYADSIGLVTGWTPAVNAQSFKQAWEGYVEELLTKQNIANECGIPVEELDTYVKKSGDNLILGLLKDPIRPIRRDQWEKSFQQFMIEIMATKKEGK
jgi:hypothetical protein